MVVRHLLPIGLRSATTALRGVFKLDQESVWSSSIPNKSNCVINGAFKHNFS